jgi:hypothetical protein
MDWILRCGDGKNLKNSSKYKIWEISKNCPANKHFINNVRQGDRLWFVKSKSNGKLIAVATYQSHNSRNLGDGPLIDTSLSNEELGWTGSGIYWNSDIEIHYTDLYGLNNCDLFTHIKGSLTIRKNDAVNSRVNLPVEYSYIVKYSKVTSEL